MPAPSQYRISLVLLVSNEAASIHNTITEAKNTLVSSAADYEIIVVDRGSTDGTIDVLRTLAEQNPRVRIISQTDDQYGAALRKGLEAASLELIAFGDSASFIGHDLTYLLPLTAEYDIACNYAADQGTLFSRTLKVGYRALAAALLGSPAHRNSVMTIIRRTDLPSILPASNNAFAATELIARAKLAPLTIAQAELPRANARSGKAPSFNMYRALRDLLRFWWTTMVFPAPVAPARFERGWFWAGLLTLIAVLAPLQICDLAYPLTEPDEGRYAELCRHMWITGDWIIPMVNQQPFYDKPPLFYWLVTASYQIFGPSDWSARLIPALASLFTVIAVFIFGSRIFGTRTGFLAALTLGLTVGFVQIGRVIVLDSMLTLFVTLALFLGYEAVQGKKLSWRWWLASAVCCGLGVMTKGPIALVLTAPPLTCYAWLSRRSRLTLGHWTVYGVIALGMLIPWFIAVIARDPSFVSHFIVDQHLARFLYKYHQKPAWFYVAVLVIGCLPWSVLLVPFLRFQFARAPEVRAWRQQALGLFVLWALWPFLFFSMAHSKLVTYTLPSVPAIFVLIGCLLNYVLFEKSLFQYFHRERYRLPRWTVGGLAVVWLGVAIVAERMRLIGVIDQYVHMGLALSCLTALTIWGRKLSPQAAWLCCAILGAVVLFDAGHHFVPAYSQRHSPREAVDRLVRAGETTIVCYGAEWGSVPFYLEREDIVFNLTRRPGEEITRFIAEHPHFALVVKTKADMQSFQQALPADRVVATVAEMNDYTVAQVRTSKSGYGPSQ